MKVINRFLVVMLLSLTASSSYATLIDNGTFTTDDTTGLDWHDIRLTGAHSYNDLMAGGGGYLAAGWSIATQSQLCDLFDDTGNGDAMCLSGVVGATSHSATTAYANQLIQLLGPVGATSGLVAHFASGLSGPTEPNRPVALGCVLTANSCFGGTISAPKTSRYLNWTQGDNALRDWFLVRDASVVPEPTTLALLVLGLAGIGFSVRKST